MSDTETSDASPTNEASETQTEEPPEDHAITELKSTIAQLETEVKQKKTSLSNLQEAADRYTKAGYARQVAQVENNKRMRGANMADNKGIARAAVIETFLPVLDDLDAVWSKYEGDEFAKSLSALRTEFMSSLHELGVTEYEAKVGDVVDGGRIVSVSEEHSEEFGKGTVISVLKKGLEISGNVVRPAECVGSLGSDKVEEETAAEEEADAGEDATGEEAASE